MPSNAADALLLTKVPSRDIISVAKLNIYPPGVCEERCHIRREGAFSALFLQRKPRKIILKRRNYA